MCMLPGFNAYNNKAALGYFCPEALVNNTIRSCVNIKYILDRIISP